MAQYNTIDLTGTRARFFFPTDASRVPPTNEADIPQSGVEPGLPEPDVNNVSDDGVSIGVVGRLRQDAATDPTVTVRIEDLVGTLGGNYTVRDVEAGRITVSQFLEANTAKRRATVPRYSINRANDDQSEDSGQVGIATSWELLEEIDTDAPGTTGAPIESGPAYCVDRHGNLLLAWTVTESGVGTPYVVVYRYAPHDAVTHQHILTIDIEAETGGSGFIVSDLEFLRRGDDVYVLAASGTQNLQLRAFLLRGTDEETAAAIYLGDGFEAGFTINRVAATHTEGGTLVAVQQTGTRGILFGHTQDLRNFETISGDAAAVAFSEFRQTRDRLGAVTDIYASSSTVMWATTSAGQLLGSIDGGQTWAGTEVPTDGIRNKNGAIIPLYSVAQFGATLLACGSDGIVLKSTDTGVTWSVVRYAKGLPGDVFETGQFNATECAKTDITVQSLRKVKMISATRAWIVGGAGTVYYTSDGGTTWTAIRKLNSAGSYTDFVVDDVPVGNVMLVVGDADVHKDTTQITDAEQGTRACLIVNADNAGTATFTNLVTEAEAGERDGGVTAVTIERFSGLPAPNGVGAIGYCVTRGGRVLRFDGDGTTVAFTAIAQLPSNGDYADIDSPDQATGGATGEVVVAGTFGLNVAGYVYQSTDGDSGDLSTTASTFVAQAIQQGATALWMTDVDTGAVGTVRGLWRAVEGRNFRQQPDLMTLRSGAVLYACNNSDKGWTELYRAERPAPGEFPNFRLVQRIALDRDGLGDPINRAPRMTQLVDGSVLLAVGLKHWIGVNDGRLWVDAATDPRIPTPVTNHGTTADYVDSSITTNTSLRANRAVIEYNGDILFSAVPSGDGTKIGIFRCWHWSSTGTYYRPIIQGVPLSLGVDGVRAVFTGDPAPRDVWTIRPRYLYRASYLATDSPTAEVWHSKADNAQVQIIYDAQDAAVTDALGARTFWTGSFFAVFGTTFGRASFAISDPSNAASFTSRDLTIALDTGAATGPASAITSNILKCAGKTWTPGQWAPGPRRFFVRMTNQSLAYRIVANGADWLEVNGAVDLSGSSSDRAFGIYSDRIVWDGTGGSGPGSAGLLGTDYQHGRLIYLTIPAQSTPDGYYEAGRFFVGQEIAADSEARDFLFGAKFRPVTNTEQDVSKGGIKSLRHYGRTGRVWEIQFAHETADALSRKLGSLLAKLREPFVVMWDGSDEQTSTLVRLVDAAEVANTIGNRFDSQWLLEEVV